MKRFIKKIFLFILITLIAYPILVFISGYFSIANALRLNVNYRKGSYGHMFTRVKEVNQIKGDADILFLGSSHAYRSFDPRNFPGKKTFNLGSSSQTPIQTNVLLKRYLDKINPELVIYEVYPETLGADGVESSLDLIANDRNDLHSLKMSLELNNIKTYNTLIYGTFADVLNLDKSFEEPLTKDSDTYIPGGYVESKLTNYKKGTTPKRNSWSLRDEQIQKFKENLLLLRKRKVKVVLVYAPIPGSLYNSYTNNDYVDSLMNSFGVPYYNFNEILSLEDSLDFLDADHLNQTGVDKFNSRLKEVLNL